MKARALLTVAALVFAGDLAAQTVTTGFVYGGVTFGKHLEGAGRFGIGLDFRLSPHFDLGGEIGTIHSTMSGFSGPAI
jgi:hypothetical protein